MNTSNECKQSHIAFSFSNRQHSFSGKCTEILCAWCELSYVPVSSSHHLHILKIKNTEYLKAYYAVTFHIRGQLLGIEVYPVIDRQLNWQLTHVFAKIVLCYFIFLIFLGWKIAHPENLLDKEIKSFSKKYLRLTGGLKCLMTPLCPLAFEYKAQN